MKLSEFSKVEKLKKTLIRLSKGIKECDAFIEKIKDKGKDSETNGLESIGEGYWLSLCEHPDGSGEIVNLSGCYIGKEVIEFTREELLNKSDKVIDELEKKFDVRVDTKNPG